MATPNHFNIVGYRCLEYIVRTMPCFRLMFAFGFIALSLGTPDARADGIPVYYDVTGWHVMAEDAQVAAVSLHDGRETLLLQVPLTGREPREKAERLVWITPVPAPASSVKVDILRGFPEFNGVQPLLALIHDIREELTLMAATQIYPGFLILMKKSGMADAIGEEMSGVAVAERIRRDGIELELASADSLEALSVHLHELEVDFPSESLRPLARYTGAQGCFAIYRISDFSSYLKAVEAERDRMPRPAMGIEVSFPAGTGFFPLLASSALPNQELTILVTAVGFFEAVEPKPEGLRTRQYFGSVRVGLEASAALGVPVNEEAQRYTRFHLNAKPRDLSSDLHFSPGAPLSTEIAFTLLTSSWAGPVGWLLYLALFLGLSALAAMLARLVWPATGRLNVREAALLGLANLGTLLGFLIAAAIVSRRRGLRFHLALRLTLATSGIFCVLLLILWMLTKLV